MKKVKIVVSCNAVYETEVEVPSYLETDKDILYYINDGNLLDDAPIEELTYDNADYEEAVEVLYIGD